jgi:hypothetical protein
MRLHFAVVFADLQPAGENSPSCAARQRDISMLEYQAQASEFRAIYGALGLE